MFLLYFYPQARRMSACRILYLEDDENDVCLLEAKIASDGLSAEVLHASTPWDFAECLASGPDIIFIDGKVAGFGAMAALDLAKARCPAVPLFCLTGLVTPEKESSMIAGGASGCLSKHDLTAVSALIREVTRRRQDSVRSGGKS